MADKSQSDKPKVTFKTIDEGSEGQRIDNYLLRVLKGVPKSRIYRILRKGEVRVNKGRIRPEYKLKLGDMVRIPPITVSEKRPGTAISPSLDRLLDESVIYEDEALLVLNKPAGLAVHGGSGVSLGLIEALRAKRPNAKYLELVHRLDRDTSGCVMVAKKRSMLKSLHEQLRSDGITKIYWALVEGRWSKRKEIVNIGLEKNELMSGERIVRATPDGKRSITEFSILKSYEQASLIEARPITGRTHQIRVHTQYAGHPILGDQKYGKNEVNKHFKSMGLSRMFLHAAELQITMADHETPLVIKAALDEPLTQFLKSLEAG